MKTAEMKNREIDRRSLLKSAAALAAATIPLSSPLRSWAETTQENDANPPTPAAAKIKIDLDRKIGTIDKNIYGNFTEHLGRCIYGGIYDEGSPLSDSDGFRKDVLAAARAMHVSVLRWPGGNFSSGYNWKDGIGPKDQRPRRWDTAWQEEESNRFGTDEFIEYCRKLGAEPYICVNMGTGTMQEAADWVEYCNATTDTYWANQRRKNGHPDPYNVKYWALGNEVYGSWQAGHKDAPTYAADALEFGKMMRWVDPTIKLVACGGPGVDWNFPVLEKLVYLVDYISLHHYGGSLDTAKEFADARAFENQVRALDAVITAVMSRIESRDAKKERVAIAVDEWNIWFRSWFHRGDNHMLEEIYNLRDALWIASGLNMFHRNCRTVKLADLAQLVNVIAPIMTSPTGIVLQTIYYPLKLYTDYCGDVALDPLVRSDTFAGLPEVPYLDVSVTTDQDARKLTLAVVNRHPSNDISTEIEIEGFRPQSSGESHEINGPSLDATNTFANPNQVTAKPGTFTGAGAKFSRVFPAHSVSILVMRSQP